MRMLSYRAIGYATAPESESHSLLRLVLEDQLALEQERAGDDHAVAGLEPVGDDLAAQGLAAELDRADHEGPLPLAGDEDGRLPLDLDDRAERDGRSPSRSPWCRARSGRTSRA